MVCYKELTILRSSLSSYSPPSPLTVDRPWFGAWVLQTWASWPLTLRVLLAAVGLVVVPVFFEAPLVRSLPWLSLTLTGSWVLVGVALMTHSSTRIWGDILVGFAWTWLAGSLYWGWFRWEPFVHLPLESVGIPIVLLLLLRGHSRVGCYFYLGSLLGTAVTDLYVYWMDLVPLWRQVMVAEPDQVAWVLRDAIAILQTPIAASRALLLGLGLLTVGVVPLRSQQPCWWAFSGAVLSTLLVDGLFAVSALLA